MKKLLSYTLLLALSIFIFWACINHVTKEKEYCGRVITKEAFPSYATKHGNYQGTTHSIVVNFTGIGYQALDVSTNTYYKTKVGENICFDLRIDRYEDTYNGWLMIPVFIAGIAAFVFLGLIVFHFIPTKD